MTPEIVILTGAGISAESGLGTFRDLGGLWTQVRLEDVATPEAYQRDPEFVLKFYDDRRANARAASPNAAPPLRRGILVISSMFTSRRWSLPSVV